ncbi:Folliculin-interacting protein N-terminus-domain-containing protein [Pleurostoma richardsiae]|uniref:Folliculin-interacting protein N-terminus-domain-containing protein n=1 Tax=Pleurostoma richardsiae TaxID=41990 RepID=A0AA38VLU0_9PEZI|nr:Folliculin-interacting protein N-terminus-domain-containing protein [Pleurostoma richardsiae]
MLGKLLNLTSGAAAGPPAAQAPSSKPVSSLDSVQEDIHTRNLLFPDAQALYEHRHDQVFPLSSSTALPASTANAFDYNGDIDLDTRDVRVIIMQDALSSAPASLLYDSQAPPPPAAAHPSPTDRPMTAAGLSHQALQEARRGQISPRKISLTQPARPVVIQPDSPQPRQGAFDRRGSVQGRNQRIETEAQRAMREYGEEVATFSGCIFGNNEFLAYKGTSTKVHVVPSDPRHEYSSSIIGDGRGSVGRSSTRSSKLAQSFSSEMVSPFNPLASSSSPRIADRKKVLITRLFPVNLPGDNNPSTPQHFAEDSSGYPFPYHGDDNTKAKPKKIQPKQKRTPMYAVALVINLPQGQPQGVPTPGSRSTFRGPSSYTEQESFPSSFSSVRRAGWTLVGQGGGSDTFDSPYSLDVEDRIDAITQHWDIIMRTLTHLQSVVATNIFTLLKQADMGSPDPLPASLSSTISRTPSLPRRKTEEGGQAKPQKTNTKFITLLPNCLADDRQIRAEVDIARTRIVSGLRATRVITGQNRWGIWREEARQIARWGGGREQGFFFLDLLTGFLSVHTDWLQALAPPKYRRQYFLQQKAKNEEDLSLPVRTVIVGNDKIVARRLIFLLSAFLPANQQLASVRAHRPSTSASVGAFSQSPPSYIVPILKEESLRRRINRRAAPRQHSHSRTASMQAPNPRSSIPSHLSHLSSELGTRKSSAATTTTITPETTLPHFSTLQKLDMSSSRWGSVISGLWSARRRDSTQTTLQSRDSVRSGDSYPASPRKPTIPRDDPLAKMVQEARMAHDPAGDESPGVGAGSPQTPRQFPDDGQEDPAVTRREPAMMDRTPDPNGAFESPVKTTINMDDGVIDVDVPFPDYITSFETAVSSPSSSGYLSTPGLGSVLDAFEQQSRIAVDGDVPMNVAGWLQRYHPDFALQAIPPQGDLLEQIKASLRTEPSPVPSVPLEPDQERWVDVSCALVVDTASFSITLIRYRRLIKPKPAVDRTLGGPLLFGSAAVTPSISPYERLLDEDFAEEPITALDELLADAVEKVIAQPGDFSSAASSRTASERRPSVDESAADSDDSRVLHLPAPPAEVPRSECKAVVLAALEGVVKQVVEERQKGSQASSSSSSGGHERESILRQAVKTWLEMVDVGGD